MSRASTSRPLTAGPFTAGPVAVLATLLALLAGCLAPVPAPQGALDLAGGIEAYLGPAATEDYAQVRAVVVDVGGERRFVRGDPGSRGNVYSVTKSVVATLIGIAVAEGRIGGVEQTLGELLPGYAPTMPDPVRAATLHQVLTMTAGIATDQVFEQPPGPGADWAAYALTVGPQTQPGSGFAYSTSGSHLLSAVLTQATGRPALDYAREKLLGPLGIHPDPASGSGWDTDPQGRQLGGTGLLLNAEEMLALGRLYLAGGNWNGTQLVPAAWIADATRGHVPTGAPLPGYGYQWWVTTADGHRAFAATGYGGQLVEVVPDLDLVVVVRSEVGAHPGAPPEAFAALVDTVIAPAVDAG